MIETPLTLWYEHFRSISKYDWVPRLLDSASTLAACPKAATQVRESGWRHLRLPLPVVHPGVFPNGASPLESLLRTTAENIEHVLYAFGDDHTPSLLVVDAGRSGLTVGSVVSREEVEAHEDLLVGSCGGAIRTVLKRMSQRRQTETEFGRLLAEHGKTPIDLCPDIIPVPPLNEMASTSLVESWSTLFAQVRRSGRLVDLNPPALVRDNENRKLQIAFDRAFDQTCLSLELSS